MAVSEFVLGFLAIVIGLAVADLLTSLHRLLRAGRKVKWDWLAPAFAALMLYLTVIFWWFSFRWYADATTMTIASFVPKFLFLAITYLMMAAALPDEVPDEGLDLRHFYLSSRLHLWGLVTISLLLIISVRLVDGTFALAQHWRDGISVVLAACAALTGRIWVHALTIAWLFALMLYYNFFASISS